MPRSRNRTTANKFEFPPEFLKTLPYPEKVNVNKKNSEATSSQLYFGESIHNKGSCGDHKALQKNHNSSSSSENLTSGVSDLDIISFGKSSSSSISWNEEFDAGATQRVQNELHRMERILQGVEPIPSNYNKDEYEQWMKTFPQLSISGHKMKQLERFEQSNGISSSSYEEIIAIDSDLSYLTENYDKDSTFAELNKINNLKSSVIEQVFQKIASKLLNKKAHNKAGGVFVAKNQRFDDNHLTPYNAQNLVKEFDSFLRISPVLLQESRNPPKDLNIRQHSSQSIAKSERLSSRWMHEEPIEYSSLPYISPSAKMKFHKTIKPKNSVPRKPRHSSKVSPTKNNHVSLPPIKTVSLPSTNQYRSISATPRQPSKGTSALSVQVDSLMENRKSRFEVANYLVQNDVRPRRNLLKRSKQM